jgi:hypothetical protein
VEATIAWSLSLLSPQALAGFPRLGVFQGGFTLDAAEQVCSSPAESEAEVDDWLSELVDASLVLTADAPSGRRFFLLQLLLAEARRRSSEDSLERRHATYFTEIAERKRAQMVGPTGAAITRELIDELPNWSQALRWAARHDPHLYCRLARGWRGVWTVSPRPADVLRSPLSADARASLTAREVATLDVLSAIAAYLASVKGSKTALERAVLHESTLQSDPDLVVLAWSFLAASCVQAGSLDDARDAAAQARAYAVDHGDVHDEAIACDISAFVASARGDLTEGRGFIERSIALAERQGDDVGVCFGLSTLGGLLIEEGDAAATRACAERLLELVRKGAGLAHNESQGVRLLGIADVMDGDLASAARHLHRSLRDQDALPLDLVGNLITAAAVLAAVEDIDAGSRTLAHAYRLATRFEVDTKDTPAPLLDYLARLEPGAASLDVLDESSPRLVPDEVMTELARIARVPSA